MNKVLKTRPELLNQLNEQETAVESGPNSALGKRAAYEILVIQQRERYAGQCNVTMFTVLTSYSVSSASSKEKTKLLLPPLLVVNESGIIDLTLETKKFIVRETVYTRLRKDCVVNLCPHVPINESDERSCYASLLIHIPWPIEGERYILQGYATAVECFSKLKRDDQIPEYVKSTIEGYQKSHIIRNNMGSVINDDNDVTDHDDHNPSSDEEVYQHPDDNLLPLPGETTFHVSPSDMSNNMGIITNISAGNKQYFINYIKNKQDQHLRNLASENTICASNENVDNDDFNSHNTRVNNYEERLKQLELNVKLLTEKQLKAYNIAVEYLSGNKGKQMLMFVTGEGGTGKSFLISLIMEFTHLYYGKQKGLYGSALAIAPTGAAANLINGHTWQAVYGKGRPNSKVKKRDDGPMTSATAKAVGAKLAGVKLIVLDEISMINLETLHEISERQIAAMGTQTTDETIRENYKGQLFGGMNMLFTGDFYQLRPVTGDAIYIRETRRLKSLKGLETWDGLNEFVILTENTRHKDDASPVMNSFLKGARIGRIDEKLLHKMNERVMTSVASAKRLAGPDAVWIAHTNKIVKQFNEDDFKERVESGLTHFRIIARHTPASQLIDAPDAVTIQKLLKTRRPNCPPPYLDLAIGTKVSCTKNLGTQIGKIQIRQCSYILAKRFSLFQC
jgi:PIF1-like helicase